MSITDRFEPRHGRHGDAMIDDMLMHQELMRLALLKVIEFLKDTDFIEYDNETLLDISRRPDDSYARMQAEYVLSVKNLLDELGESY